MEDTFPVWRLWYERKVPLRELQEEWTYEDVMKALAVTEMYSAYETAREALDKAEFDRQRREIENKSGKHRKR